MPSEIQKAEAQSAEHQIATVDEQIAELERQIEHADENIEHAQDIMKAQRKLRAKAARQLENLHTRKDAFVDLAAKLRKVR